MPPDLRTRPGLLGRATWCARGRRPARSPSALRASLGASSRSPARPCHRPRALQPGPAGLAAASNRAAPGMIRPGPAAAHVRRSQAPQSGPAGLVMTGYSTMSHVIPLRVFQILKSHRWNCNVFSGSRKLTVGNYVLLLFWLTSWRRSTDNETPHSNDAVRGRSLTMIRWPSASELPHRCTRRPTPRRRWVGSSRAGSPEVGST